VDVQQGLRSGIAVSNKRIMDALEWTVEARNMAKDMGWKLSLEVA
jgi:hypothetical protein